MAVSSKKKNDTKNKEKNIKNKNKSVKAKKNEVVTKEVVENSTSFDASNEPTFTSYDEIFNEKNKPSKNKIRYILIGIIIILCGLIYLMLPKIKLVGSNEVTITYNKLYIDPGYKGIWIFKDITNNIKVTSNFNNTKIGTYKINYQFKFGLFNLNKQRIVKVIDDIAPEIITDSDVVNVCPHADNPQIEYQAIDEYDGDITDKVLVNSSDDKIFLTIKDNANNVTNKEVIIDRSDKEAPKISLKGKPTIYLNVGSSYGEPGYTAHDNCDGDITDKVAVSGSVKSSVGNYTLTYSVVDDAGNKTEITRKVIVKNYNLYNSGTIANAIYLTFDDGPSEGTTNVILDILKEEGIKATFFVTCRGPDYLIKRMYDEGHMVALHTCSHEYSQVYASVDNYFNDLNRISDRVKNITGSDAKIIRFPGGSSNTISRNYNYGIMSTLTSMVLDKGYRYFDWNVDSNDAGGAYNSSMVYNNVVNYLSHNRANVVLMHDIKPQTRDALRDIINYGKSEGYLFGRIENDTYMVRHTVNN